MAIAFDASGAGNNAGATNTASWSHTCSGSNRILLVLASQGGSTTQDITGVTYNSVAMTKISEFYETSSSSISSWWYLIAPATGSNTVQITSGSSRPLRGMSVSYTGAAQTGQPDAHTDRSDIAAATSSTTSTTTVADNCWVLIGGRTATGANITASTNVTGRQFGSEGNYFLVGDSNAVVTPAGNLSQTLNYASSTASEVGSVSIAPSLTAAANANFLAFM